MVPEAQLILKEPEHPDRDAETQRLRAALDDAVRALARCGVTPATLATLSERERGNQLWQEAARVWTAAGVDFELPCRVVLRCTGREPSEAQEFASPEVALEAAIAAIEVNESYPEAIEVDGRCIMDRASILRAWEDRHDPG